VVGLGKSSIMSSTLFGLNEVMYSAVWNGSNLMPAFTRPVVCVAYHMCTLLETLAYLLSDQ